MEDKEVASGGGSEPPSTESHPPGKEPEQGLPWAETTSVAERTESKRAHLRDGSRVTADISVEGDLVAGREVEIRGRVLVGGAVFLGDGTSLSGRLDASGPLLLGRSTEVENPNVGEGVAVAPAGAEHRLPPEDEATEETGRSSEDDAVEP